MTVHQPPGGQPLRSIDALVEAGLAAPERREALQKVAERYAVSVTPAVAGLIDPSDPADPIARQFIPDAAELATLPQELADPKQYQAFEERQTRELVQAYTSGVQQIPEIRARIEAAEQGGERSAEEIDEARAALGQLEMMRDKLQRESPQLLPGDSAPTSPAAP